MKKQILTTFFASIAMAGTMAQTGSVPRLVVGITIDQLRSDYLNAFMPLYGEGGFKLLLEKGQRHSFGIEGSRCTGPEGVRKLETAKPHGVLVPVD